MNARTYIILTLIALFLGAVAYVFWGRAPHVTNYPSKGTDIIAFGDSLVFGTGASSPENNFVSLLSQKIGKPIVNLGIAGDTTAMGFARIRQLDQYRPKVVLLLLGGNDHLRKVPIETTEANLSKLIQEIQRRGAVVLLLGVRGNALGFNDPFQPMFERLSEKYHTAYVSDVLSGLFGKSEYMSDAVHPNDAGYAKIAERVYPVLEKVSN